MKHALTGLALVSLPGLALALRAPSAPSAAPAAAVPATAATTSFEVDPLHSSAVFRTRHVGVADFFGRFDQVTGKVELDPDDPARSSVLIEIAADSIDTNNEQRDGHLQSPDFFSAKEYPTILFESTKVAKKGDDLSVTGLLTIRDQTKEITVDVHAVGAGDTMFGDYRAGWSTEFTIDMRDFGLAFVQKNPKALGPDVHVWIALEAVRQ